MNFSNIKTPLNLPISPTAQNGGKRRRHKRNSKCPLCKRGGDDGENNLSNKNKITNLDELEKGTLNDRRSNDIYDDALDKMERGKEVFANDDDYDKLDKMERGVNTLANGTGKGGTRKRRHRKHHKRTYRHGKSKKRHTRGKRHGHKSRRVRHH